MRLFREAAVLAFPVAVALAVITAADFRHSVRFLFLDHWNIERDTYFLGHLFNQLYARPAMLVMVRRCYRSSSDANRDIFIIAPYLDLFCFGQFFWVPFLSLAGVIECRCRPFDPQLRPRWRYGHFRMYRAVEVAVVPPIEEAAPAIILMPVPPVLGHIAHPVAEQFQDRPKHRCRPLT